MLGMTSRYSTNTWHTASISRIMLNMIAGYWAQDMSYLEIVDLIAETFAGIDTAILYFFDCKISQ